MQSFNSEGVNIAYNDEGQGEPILLIHGFASNAATNWRDAHWLRTLTGAGRRVVAFDNRGHGQSEKLYDPELYGAPEMAEDARRLLDHLGIERADVMGYSMGARIAAFLVFKHPERGRSLVLAGAGINFVHGMVGSGPIARALEAPRIEDCDQRDRAKFPSLRRADRQRSEGARRLHKRAAREDPPRGPRQDRGAHAGRGGQQGRDRGFGRGACKAYSGRPTP